MTTAKPAVITGAIALERIMASEIRPTVRIHRKCPSCYAVAHHVGNAGGVAHRIVCSQCGHAWQGRVTNKEQC